MRMIEMNTTARPHCVAGMVAALSLAAMPTHAAVPGITGPTFALDAKAAYISQPDGSSVYSWGYGCAKAPTGTLPGTMAVSCPDMQLPGPTLIVTEGDPVSVTLTNALPSQAGNTSIIFSGFDVNAVPVAAADQAPGCPATPPVGLLTTEAAPGCAVTYTFTATTVGTHGYHSGTQSDLQVEMGLYGAIIILPKTIPSNCAAIRAAVGDGLGLLVDLRVHFR